MTLGGLDVSLDSPSRVEETLMIALSMLDVEFDYKNEDVTALIAALRERGIDDRPWY